MVFTQPGRKRQSPLCYGKTGFVAVYDVKTPEFIKKFMR